MEEFSKDISMSAGLYKCAMLLIINGKYTTTSILPGMPKLNNKDNKANKAYFFLVILNVVNFHINEVKKMTT
eukprot:3862202-Ditylum_brightwellii.AAC.1